MLPDWPGFLLSTSGRCGWQGDLCEYKAGGYRLVAQRRSRSQRALRIRDQIHAVRAVRVESDGVCSDEPAAYANRYDSGAKQWLVRRA